MGNPFLTDVPFVALVRAVRVVGGEEVESLDEDTRRIWFRVKPRLTPDPIGTGELLPDDHYRFPHPIPRDLFTWR